MGHGNTDAVCPDCIILHMRTLRPLKKHVLFSKFLNECDFSISLCAYNVLIKQLGVVCEHVSMVLTS